MKFTTDKKQKQKGKGVASGSKLMQKKTSKTEKVLPPPAINETLATPVKKGNKAAYQVKSVMSEKATKGKLKTKANKPKSGTKTPNQPESEDEDVPRGQKTTKTVAKKKAAVSTKPEDEVVTSESETEEEEDTAKEPVKPADKKKDVEHCVFVGNLPSSTTKSMVKSLFKQYGTILSVRFRGNLGQKIMHRKDQVKVKSLIAYVRFSAKEEVQKACAMDGQMVEQNRIRVCPQNQKQLGEVKSTVFVGNISTATTDNDLYEFFSTVGEIEYVRQIANKCIGFVCFKKGVSIKKALKLNQQQLNGRALRVMEVDPERTNVKKNKKGNPVKRNKLPQQGSTKNGGPTAQANDFHGKVVAGGGPKNKKKSGFGKKAKTAKIIAQKLKAAAKVSKPVS
ncbi:RNA-binding protein 34-like [Anopheles bellator]|uniref:RNA-binding protein 34-like n=1 Tax=Anopheles bellator TaxID=139047 RepID=UPI00264828CB|nr:RNA-binding protein 34-like [Anopheles bellator]